MKIESIEVRHYRLPLDPPFRASWDPRPRTAFDSTIVVVRAGGCEGVGSGDAMLGLTGHEDLFIGQDVFDIERHVAVLDNLRFTTGARGRWRSRSGTSRASCAGSRCGGCSAASRRGCASTHRRASASRLKSGQRRPYFCGMRAIRQSRCGFMLILPKISLSCGRCGRRLAPTLRSWSTPTRGGGCRGIRRRRGTTRRRPCRRELSGLRVYWLEEPLHRHDYRGLSKLRTWSTVKIAGGEGNREFSEFAEYLAHGSLDVYQPDVAWSTGVLRAKQLAERVRASGAMYTPHLGRRARAAGEPAGRGRVLGRAVRRECAATAELDAGTARLLPSPIVADGGWVDLGDRPGLGVEIDSGAIERWRVG